MTWRFFFKLGIKPPYDPAIPFLGVYLEETKIEKDPRTPMFISALFTIARTRKQPRCPSTEKWIKRLWYIYTMEYYSAIKRNTSESVLMRWMNIETIIQSEVSENEGQMSHINAYVRIQKSYVQGSKGDIDVKNFGLSGRRGWDDLRE